MPLPRWNLQPNSLHVEGPDDLHAILRLLERHGVPYAKAPLLPSLPRIVDTGGKEPLLAGMPRAVQVSTGRPIGFVLDADSPLASTWNAVRNRLAEAGVPLPQAPDPTGFIGASPAYRATVGVWLMPDNEHDGTLETFLRSLIEERDRLIGHAGAATDRAKQLGAGFPEVRQSKAVMHAWLAWQEQPGLPYGAAVTAQYFRHDSPAALAFIAWFKQLYGIA